MSRCNSWHCWPSSISRANSADGVFGYLESIHFLNVLFECRDRMVFCQLPIFGDCMHVLSDCVAHLRQWQQRPPFYGGYSCERFLDRVSNL
mmetsp:Transcript_26594/g.48732  ORF Transcript_26594/g.48732 Transcript_26594/m.48732 type:complete len:91 (-) Transcript_26594:1260-1532(-)